MWQNAHHPAGPWDANPLESLAGRSAPSTPAGSRFGEKPLPPSGAWWLSYASAYSWMCVLPSITLPPAYLNPGGEGYHRKLQRPYRRGTPDPNVFLAHGSGSHP